MPPEARKASSRARMSNSGENVTDGAENHAGQTKRELGWGLHFEFS